MAAVGGPFQPGDNQQMAHRATHAVKEVVWAHPEDLVWIVTHADIIKAVLADALGMHLDQFQRIVIDTACGSASSTTRRGGRSWRR